MLAAASNATQRTLGSLGSDSAFKDFIRRIEDGCFSYADANAVTEAEYLEFSKDLQYEGDRFAFANTCVDHFESSSSLRPATGAYKKFYTTAGVTSDDIEKVNTELAKAPAKTAEQCAAESQILDEGECKPCGSGKIFDADTMTCKEGPEKNPSKWSLSVSATGNPNRIYADTGLMKTSSDDSSGGGLEALLRAQAFITKYFGTSMHGFKIFAGAGLLLPLTSIREEGGLKTQDAQVGFGLLGSIGLGGVIKVHPKWAIDADVALNFGGMYVNKVVEPDFGEASGWNGFFDITFGVGPKAKIDAAKIPLALSVKATFNIMPDTGIGEMTKPSTNPAHPGAQAVFSPGGKEPFGWAAGVAVTLEFK